MSIIKRLDFIETTAFMERKRTIDKLNEVIDTINDTPIDFGDFYNKEEIDEKLNGVLTNVTNDTIITYDDEFINVASCEIGDIIYLKVNGHSTVNNEDAIYFKHTFMFIRKTIATNDTVTVASITNVLPSGSSAVMDVIKVNYDGINYGRIHYSGYRFADFDDVSPIAVTIDSVDWTVYRGVYND